MTDFPYRKYRIVPLVFGAIYLISGGLLLSFPVRMLNWLNFVPQKLGFLEVVPADEVNLWMLLAADLLFILAAISFSSSVSRRPAFFTLHLFSLLAIAGTFLYHYSYVKPYFVSAAAIGIAGVFALILSWYRAKNALYERKQRRLTTQRESNPQESLEAEQK